MVLPTTVIDYEINLIEKNRSEFPEMADPVEGSEDMNANAVQASIIVYADFDDTAELDSNKRALNIPCSLYFTCSSGSFETASESFNEAFMMALTVLRLVSQNNRIELKNIDKQLEPVHIQLQDIPITVLRKSAAGSTVQCNFKYNISRI